MEVHFCHVRKQILQFSVSKLKLGLFKVLKVLEFDFLTFKSLKTFGSNHIYEEVLEKCLNV